MASASFSNDEYVDFTDMGNYDHSAQRNIDKKMMGLGMVPPQPRLGPSSYSQDSGSASCDSESCTRNIKYLQRIVKSLLRQMNIRSHVFGPGEAITIDLQAEIKFDDYMVLTKFMNAKDLGESDKFLNRVDQVLSNFIHVSEHASCGFDIFDRIINFPAFSDLKFWIILLTSMVIGSLIVMLFVKAVHTPRVHIQLFYGFLIIFILSCVWSFSNLYEDKKAELMAHTTQHSGLPPKDCDYQNFGMLDSISYWWRVNVFKYTDQCTEYYGKTMTDPFWKINPMQAISQSVAFFFFEPLGYIGKQTGSFFLNFMAGASWWMKPFMMALSVLLVILVFYGPFRIASPFLTIEPAWRPEMPALERGGNGGRFGFAAIGHVRNEIMERPDGPVVKSVRDAGTDMDGFLEFLADEGYDEVEIRPGPFSRFKKEEFQYKKEIKLSPEKRLNSLSAKVSLHPILPELIHRGPVITETLASGACKIEVKPEPIDLEKSDLEDEAVQSSSKDNVALP